VDSGSPFYFLMFRNGQCSVLLRFSAETADAVSGIIAGDPRGVVVVCNL
jgi:hypothetical protein